MEPDSRSQLGFVCVGSATQDVYLRNSDGLAPVCANPEECFYNIHLGDKIYVNQVDFMVGGGASNAAVTFARGGQAVSFMGMIGNDPASMSIMQVLGKEGVDMSLLTRSNEHNSDYSTLLLAPNGERTILTYRGCGNFTNVTDFNLDRNANHYDWMYLTSLVGKFDVYDQLADQARARGVKIAFNPGGKELLADNHERLLHILSYVTVLSVNKQEAQQIVPGDTLEELLVGLKQHCPVVIITDGVNGSIASDGQTTVRAGLYADTEISVDRTGAGDAFCSGFVLRYALGDSLVDAVHYAAANSAAVVQAIGSKPGILRAGAEQHLDSMPLELR